MSRREQAKHKCSSRFACIWLRVSQVASGCRRGPAKRVQRQSRQIQQALYDIWDAKTNIMLAGRLTHSSDQLAYEQLSCSSLSLRPIAFLGHTFCVRDEATDERMVSLGSHLPPLAPACSTLLPDVVFSSSYSSALEATLSSPLISNSSSSEQNKQHESFNGLGLQAKCAHWIWQQN